MARPSCHYPKLIVGILVLVGVLLLVINAIVSESMSSLLLLIAALFVAATLLYGFSAQKR
jgi:cytochrome bd-type quinol oxidase subunit 2